MVVSELLAVVGFEPDQDGVSKVDDAIGKLKGAIGVLAGLFATSQAAQFFSRVTSEITRSVRAAESLGITTQAVQELGFAFEAVGAPAEDVTDALATLTDRAEDAKAGMQSFIDDFRLVGIEVSDLRGKNPEELFETFAQAVGNTEDANKAATAAVRVFGDDLGQRLLPLLRSGKVGLNELRQEAQDLGIIVTEEQAENARQFQLELNRVRAIFMGIAQVAVVDLAPSITDILKGVREWVGVNRTLIKQNMRLVLETLAFVFRGLASVLFTTLDLWRRFNELVGGARNAILVLAGAMAGLKVAQMIVLFQQLGTAAVVAWLKAAGPVLLMAALITIVFLLLEDMWGWLTGRESLMGKWFGESSQANIERVRGMLLGLLGIFVIILALLNAPLALVLAIVAGVALLIIHWDMVKAAFMNFFSQIPGAFANMFKEVANFFVMLAGIIIGETFLFLQSVALAVAKWAADLWFPVEDWFRNTALKVKTFFDGIMESIKESIRDVLGTIDDVVGKGTRLLNKIPGVDLDTSGEGIVGSLFGGGTAGPGVDRRAQLDRRTNNRAVDNSSRIEAEININGSNLSEEETRRAVRNGLVDASALEKTSRDLDGSAS